MFYFHISNINGKGEWLRVLSKAWELELELVKVIPNFWELKPKPMVSKYSLISLTFGNFNTF